MLGLVGGVGWACSVGVMVGSWDSLRDEGLSREPREGSCARMGGDEVRGDDCELRLQELLEESSGDRR